MIPIQEFSNNVVAFTNVATRVIVNEGRNKWQDSAVNRLNELVKLEIGWDGYKGIPVSFENANFSYRMLEAVCGYDAPDPQIVPGSYGDLQVEWHVGSIEIELHVTAPNRVHAWRKTRDTGPEGEEIDLTNDFTVIVDWIKELSVQKVAHSSSAA